MTSSVIEREWQIVKDVPSLFKYYGSQREYQKWRARFLKAGFLKKKRGRSKEDQLVHNRAYYAEWRKRNSERIAMYNLKFWKKKIEGAQELKGSN